MPQTLPSFLRLPLTVPVPLRPQSKPPAKAVRKDGGSLCAQCLHLLSDVLFIKQSRFCLEGFQSAFSSHETQTNSFIHPIHWPQDPWSWISWKKVHLAPRYSGPQAAGGLAHPTGVLGFSAGNSRSCAFLGLSECHPLEKLRVGLPSHLPGSLYQSQLGTGLLAGDTRSLQKPPSRQSCSQPGS